VLFCPPDPQYWQKPIVLLPYPQLSGSFWEPAIQEPVKELLGSAQVVKSARISASASLPGSEHRELSALMSDSLSANSTYCYQQRGRVVRQVGRTQVSAQAGWESSSERLQSSLEFCIILLHITVVV
jgi:hypothetical protein